MGPWMRQLLTTLCVASPLALFARGGADLTAGFCLRTMSYHRPTVIVGPVLDIVAISRDVVGASCDEWRWLINMCLLFL
jgi:hypothetical protein